VSKPSTLPSWATDTLYPSSSEAFSLTPTRTVPLTSYAAAGWAPKDKPPAQIMNWFMGLVSDWLAYLDGGALDGDITIQGNLLVEGSVTTVAVDGSHTGDYKHPGVLRPFGIDFNDTIICTGGTGVSRTAGVGGCTVGVGGTAYFKLPTMLAKERLNQVNLWFTSSGAFATGYEIYSYDETTLTYFSETGPLLVTGTSSGVVLTAVITTPGETVSKVYVLGVTPSLGDLVIKKGELFYDAP
jgi:hypothetical protein